MTVEHLHPLLDHSGDLRLFVAAAEPALHVVVLSPSLLVVLSPLLGVVLSPFWGVVLSPFWGVVLSPFWRVVLSPFFVGRACTWPSA